MIYSVIPTDIIFFDGHQVRQRHIKMYDGLTFEMSNGKINRIISTNPHDYLKYSKLIGQNECKME